MISSCSTTESHPSSSVSFKRFPIQKFCVVFQLHVLHLLFFWFVSQCNCKYVLSNGIERGTQQNDTSKNCLRKLISPQQGPPPPPKKKSEHFPVLHERQEGGARITLKRCTHHYRNQQLTAGRRTQRPISRMRKVWLIPTLEAFRRLSRSADLLSHACIRSSSAILPSETSYKPGFRSQQLFLTCFLFTPIFFETSFNFSCTHFTPL